MADSTANPQVVLETSQGAITLELFPNEAPVTTKNFLTYVDEGFYNNTIFHRVISGFMIQGGGFEPGMRQKPTHAPIKNESANGVANERGTVAMARTSAPDSATAQFFINHQTNGFLDRKQAQDGVGYCVFGKVVGGMDVVDRIAAVATTTRGGHQNVPTVDVVIQTARRA